MPRCPDCGEELTCPTCDESTEDQEKHAQAVEEWKYQRGKFLLLAGLFFGIMFMCFLASRW